MLMRLEISVLIIEHNMDFILRQGVDRIIVMNEGEVLMQKHQMRSEVIEKLSRPISGLLESHWRKKNE